MPYHFTCPVCGRAFTDRKDARRVHCSNACYHVARVGDPQRFWDYVDRSGGPDACWPWLRARSRRVRGYGRFTQDGVGRDAHREAWERTHGPVPAGLFVLHTCDVPHCCNPAHLYLGTQTDNMRDRKARGHY